MKSISKRQKECDPNAVCSVSAFTARPLLRWKFLIVLTYYVRHCQTFFARPLLRWKFLIVLTYYVRHCQTFIKVQVLDHANNVSQSCFQSTTRSLRFFELYREFSDKFYFFFRVGGKDKPTRFLSYVEAVHGFRHLLKQEDLDKALSLCTSLKGHLKSRFLVLSDDRILPPYQPKSGKRSHPDSGNQDFVIWYFHIHLLSNCTR